jgi:hypothetical protein
MGETFVLVSIFPIQLPAQLERISSLVAKKLYMTYFIAVCNGLIISFTHRQFQTLQWQIWLFLLGAGKCSLCVEQEQAYQPEKSF